MHSPGYSKPAHGYGAPFGIDAPPNTFEVTLSSPEVSEIDPRVREVYDSLMEEFGPSLRHDDKDWAGEGFETPYEEP